jgi:hypothetical protein
MVLCVVFCCRPLFARPGLFCFGILLSCLAFLPSSSVVLPCLVLSCRVVSCRVCLFSVVSCPCLVPFKYLSCHVLVCLAFSFFLLYFAVVVCCLLLSCFVLHLVLSPLSFGRTRTRQDRRRSSLCCLCLVGLYWPCRRHCILFVSSLVVVCPIMRVVRISRIVPPPPSYTFLCLSPSLFPFLSFLARAV